MAGVITGKEGECQIYESLPLTVQTADRIQRDMSPHSAPNSYGRVPVLITRHGWSVPPAVSACGSCGRGFWEYTRRPSSVHRQVRTHHLGLLPEVSSCTPRIHTSSSFVGSSVGPASVAGFIFLEGRGVVCQCLTFVQVLEATNRAVSLLPPSVI